MEHPQTINPVTRAIGGGVFIASIVGLYLQVTEPFAGGRLAYASRLLGPVLMLLVSSHLFLQRRPHPLFVATVVVLAVLIWVFLLAGMNH